MIIDCVSQVKHALDHYRLGLRPNLIVRDLAMPRPSAGAKAWRYMNLAKFISLIDRHQLFFSSVDVFGDPYEGALPKPNQLLATKPPPLHGKSVFVNSWHLNEYESAAMWAIYSSFNSGIAIQSTYGRLVKSFSRCKERIYIGKVRYIDYSSESIDTDDILQRFTHKRKSFAYENELRAIGLFQTEGEVMAHHPPRPKLENTFQ